MLGVLCWYGEWIRSSSRIYSTNITLLLKLFSVFIWTLVLVKLTKISWLVYSYTFNLVELLFELFFLTDMLISIPLVLHFTNSIPSWNQTHYYRLCFGCIVCWILFVADLVNSVLATMVSS